MQVEVKDHEGMMQVAQQEMKAQKRLAFLNKSKFDAIDKPF